MKTIEDLLHTINDFNNIDLPGDYEYYESPLETVRETMKKNKMSSYQVVDLFVSLYEDFVLNNWDPEGNRILLCAAEYVHIQDLLNNSKYGEVFGEIHIVLKKYIINPYLKRNPSDELGVHSRVLDTEEARIWDYYMISIFEYLKNILEPEKFDALLNNEIMFRELLLEELDYETIKEEPVLEKLKNLKCNQVTQIVKKKVTKTLSLPEYDQKLLSKPIKHNIIDSIRTILMSVFDERFDSDFLKDFASLGLNKNYMSYEGYLTILTQQLSELKTQYDFLENKKQKNQMETQSYTILKQKIDYQYSYMFFVFLKSIQHYLQNKKDQNAQYIFINHFHIILSGFDFIKSDKVDFSKVITFFQEYFYESLSQEEKSKLIDLSSYK